MNNTLWDKIWINANIATLHPKRNQYGLINKGAIATKNEKISWVGDVQSLPGSPDSLANEVHDVKGNLITPGLIDCHTHLIYAGNRSNEFEMRLNGTTYEEIAKAGGGIQSTVNATRKASVEELLNQSKKRAMNFLSEGVTTLEIKSGYGLDFDSEMKILTVANYLGEILPLTIVPTFLGAHTLPLEYKNKPDEYVNFVCEKMIPAVATRKLASIVDVYCETIGFNLQQTEKLFATAVHYGLAIKCHAEQLSNLGGAKLAARYKALSADHLEYLDEEGVRAMAEAGTVAVLLPGAFYYLQEKKIPPIKLLREYQVPMAIATDCNPGTSPTDSLLLMLNMACVLFRLTPEEALLGITRHAAKALGIKNRGFLSPDNYADFVIWDMDYPSNLAYQIGGNLPLKIIRNGKTVYLDANSG